MEKKSLKPKKPYIHVNQIKQKKKEKSNCWLLSLDGSGGGQLLPPHLPINKRKKKQNFRYWVVGYGGCYASYLGFQYCNCFEILDLC